MKQSKKMKHLLLVKGNIQGCQHYFYSLHGWEHNYIYPRGVKGNATLSMLIKVVEVKVSDDTIYSVVWLPQKTKH